MTISQDRAAELADLLDDGLHAGNARERLLCIVEILRTLTDEEHALSNADIRAILVAKFGAGCSPAENTVNGDISAIRSSGCLGYEMHTGPNGTWCENTQLTPANVRLLLNAVQSSRFLTAQQSAELQESLYGLVSRHQEEDLASEVFVEQRVRKSYQEVFASCDTIARAIRFGKKIEFAYAYNDFNGAPVMLPGDDGKTLRIETPIALLFADNKYYLESYSDPAWRHGIKLMRSRVDRMFDVRISREDADRGREVYNARRSVAKRVREGFDMWDGKPRTLFLRVRADKTNEMFDRFGFGLTFGQFDGEIGDVTTTAITCVKLAASYTFFRWLSAAGDGIRIVKPKSEIWVSTGPWAKQVEGVAFDQLVDDYNVVRNEYLAYLDRARLACE